MTDSHLPTPVPSAPERVTAWGLSHPDDGLLLATEGGTVARIHPDDLAEIAETFLGARGLIPVDMTLARCTGEHSPARKIGAQRAAEWLAAKGHTAAAARLALAIDAGWLAL